MAANQYNKECAERVFQEIGGTSWSSLETLRSCAGSTEEDRVNELLEEELRSQHGDGQAVGEVISPEKAEACACSVHATHQTKAAYKPAYCPFLLQTSNASLALFLSMST